LPIVTRDVKGRSPLAFAASLQTAFVSHKNTLCLERIFEGREGGIHTNEKNNPLNSLRTKAKEKSITGDISGPETVDHKRFDQSGPGQEKEQQHIVADSRKAQYGSGL